MEIKELSGSVKKLGNNKFFLIALVIVVIMALIAMMKKDTGKSSTASVSTDVEAVLGTYPEGGVSAANANMITESVNEQNRILLSGIYEALDDMEGSMIVQQAGQQEMLSESLQGIREDIVLQNELQSQRDQSAADHLNLLFDQISGQIGEQGLQLSDQITLQGGRIMDRVEYNSLSVQDKIEQSQIHQESQFGKLTEQLQVDREYSNLLAEGIRGEIGNQNQLLNIQLNQVQEQIRGTEQYLSHRQDLISDKIGGAMNG